jgi:hypothetical protein
MLIRLILDPRCVRQWHRALVDRLQGQPGLSTALAWADLSPRVAGLDTLILLESLIFRIPRNHFSLPAKLDPCVSDDDTPDVVIDLTASRVAGGGSLPVFTLTCAEAPVDLGAFDAVLAGSMVDLTLTLWQNGRPLKVATWCVAVEEPNSLARGAGPIFARAIHMLGLAVAQLAIGFPPGDLSLPSAGFEGVKPKPVAPLVFGAQCFLGRLQRLLRTAPNWVVGVRSGSAGSGLPRFGGSAFARLADDGRRFYADPFVWSEAGRTVLFVEEYPFSTGKGVISAIELENGRPVGVPRVVIETPYHLSYPFVFAHEGSIFMVPETSECKRVELWRCTRFPDAWSLHAVLIENADLSDATLLQRDGRWFLFAASREPGGSSWDALDVWTAGALEGPWSRVGAGPAMVDVRSARPAGRLFMADGALVRPAQNCVSGYGSGLTFARIDRLDPDAFTQTVLASVSAGPPSGGIHTYNRSDDIEVVDAILARGTADFIIE